MQYIRTDKIFYHKGLQDYLENKPVAPITMELHLTNRCNMNCYYCFFGDRDKRLELNRVDALKCIYSLAQMRVKGLIFSGGGEPTIHKDFKEITVFASKHGFDIALITNGLVDISDIINQFTWVRYSLDSPSSYTYWKIKGVDKFDLAVSNIKKAVAKKGDTTIGIQMVITKDNYEQIIRMYKFVVGLGADYFQFRPLENAKYKEEEWDYIENARRALRDDPFVLTTESKWKELSGQIKQYKGCPGADFIGAIDARGDYYICCHHVGKSGCYGNLLTDDIEKVLENRKAVQDSFDYTKCPIACRGSNLNLALANFSKLEHVNFL